MSRLHLFVLLVSLALGAGCGPRSGSDTPTGVTNVAVWPDGTAGTPSAGSGETLWATTFPGTLLVSATSGRSGEFFATGLFGENVSGKWVGMRLLEMDACGSQIRSFSYGEGCGVRGDLVAVTSTDDLLVAVSSYCSTPIAGLGPNPLMDGDLIELTQSGEHVRTLASGAGYVVSGSVSVAPDGSLFVSGIDVLRKLTHTGRALWRASSEAMAVRAAPMPDGGVVVAGFPPGTGGLLPPTYLERFGADGKVLWKQDQRRDVVDLTTLKDGTIVVAQHDFFMATDIVSLLDMNGTEVAEFDTGAQWVRVNALPDDGILVTYERIVANRLCPSLRVYGADLREEWDRTVDAKCGATMEGVDVSHAGRVIVVGQLLGPADFGDGHTGTSSNETVGYALAIRR